jgi:hypothetical protein
MIKTVVEVNGREIVLLVDPEVDDKFKTFCVELRIDEQKEICRFYRDKTKDV